MLADNLKSTIAYSNARIQTDLRQPVRWLWDGVLAAYGITLLSAREKTGKSTLLSLLLDRRRQGGRLLGRNVEPGGTFLCTEENQTIWAARQPPLDFGPELLFVEPKHERGSRRRTWRNFISELFEFEEGQYDLLVIDSVMNFLPAALNNPRALRWALNELREFAGLTAAAVLLLHQTPAIRSRRHGSLAAFADILIDMHLPPGDPTMRRRTFTTVGRYPNLLPPTTADLDPAGTDYIVLPSLGTGLPALGEGCTALGAGLSALGAGLPTSPPIDTLVQILAAAAHPLTRLEILAKWPRPQTPPHRDSLSRLLARAGDLLRITRTGPGTKSEPYRYAIP